MTDNSKESFLNIGDLPEKPPKSEKKVDVEKETKDFFKGIEKEEKEEPTIEEDTGDERDEDKINKSLIEDDEDFTDKSGLEDIEDNYENDDIDYNENDEKEKKEEDSNEDSSDEDDSDEDEIIDDTDEDSEEDYNDEDDYEDEEDDEEFEDEVDKVNNHFKVMKKKKKSTEDEKLDDEIKIIEEKLNQLSNRVEENRFPRTESKTDFASGILNSQETKKICNLDEEEIYDLAEKRKFYNFLKYFGWNGLSQRVIANIRDIEDYSLSKKAKLLDSVFIDRVKQDSRNIQQELNGKRRSN